MQRNAKFASDSAKWQEDRWAPSVPAAFPCCSRTQFASHRAKLRLPKETNKAPAVKASGDMAVSGRSRLLSFEDEEEGAQLQFDVSPRLPPASSVTTGASALPLAAGEQRKAQLVQLEEYLSRLGASDEPAGEALVEFPSSFRCLVHQLLIDKRDEYMALRGGC